MKKILQIFLLQIALIFVFGGVIRAAQCGESFLVTTIPPTDMTNICQCASSNNGYEMLPNYSYSGSGVQTTFWYCCGFAHGDRCSDNADPNQYSCGQYSSEPSVPDGAICNCPGAQWESFYEWKFIWKDRGVCCGWTNNNQTQCLTSDPNEDSVYCGEVYTGEKDCICGGNSGKKIEIEEGPDKGKLCCGWYINGECKNSESGLNDIEVTSKTLNNLNPLKIGGGADLSTPGKIISRALKFFIFPIAGIILFIVLILGGFQMLAGANNSKSLEEGKQRITTAIIGFILLFAAYWIAQLLEIIFGIRILS